MAEKKPKKVAKPPARKVEKRSPSAPPVVVFFELHDVAGVRYHSDHVDIQRARIAAQTLVTSSDVSQAWIVREVEIFRAAEVDRAAHSFEALPRKPKLSVVEIDVPLRGQVSTLPEFLHEIAI